ncbi:DNA-3-methyladenine glycosylase 2 [Paenibacillus sp. 1001270B_150601_E10]|uniref:DNA-3-methyladenine glycosylase 2 n=1 Tax=Paenibacillus sp. 1001270B_150601_E10 TaxID=2787079 RepID=UPI00189CD4E8|nr:DNA-3-methyladenine glycosylase [Paenibacillus sp. 1001270B_150601_E10]
MTSHEIKDSMVFPLPELFDMMANLDYLTRDKNECMYTVNNDTITKVIPIEKQRFLVQISAVKDHQMHIRFLDARPTEYHHRKKIVAYIRDWFDLDRDVRPFYQMAKTDPLLKGTIEKSFGLRVMGIPDLFEALCWGVIGQQINLAFAYSLKKQFVERFGDQVKWDGHTYWVFPSFERIAQLSPSHLTDIKMTNRKSEYIINLSKLMASGELSKEQLMNMNMKEAEKTLVSIRGIGPWTANYVLMRCLRFPSAFPIDDVGLLNAVKALRKMDRKPTKEELLALSIPWKDWESYATFYLWRVLY